MFEAYYNNIDKLDIARSIFSAFFWDDLDDGNSSFEYFKSLVEEEAKFEHESGHWGYSIGSLFAQACGFEGASCKYGDEIGNFLHKSLRRFGISLKDTKHKDFVPRDNDDCANNLYRIADILSEFDISLWSCEGGDMYELAVSRRRDDALIKEILDLMGVMDISLVTWYAPSREPKVLKTQEEIQHPRKSEWELWMEKSRAARNSR